MELRTPNTRRNLGLTRNEWLWTLLLVAVIVGTIVGTLRAEVERGNQRMAQDTLSYLASQIHIGLETANFDDLEALPCPMFGPGTPPKGLLRDPQKPIPLQSIMPIDGYLPADPWGNAYVLLLNNTDGAPALFITCAGPTGDLSVILQQADTQMKQRVHWPIRQQQ